VGFSKALPSTSGYYREEGKKTGKKFLSKRVFSFQKPSNHAGLRFHSSQ